MAAELKEIPVRSWRITEALPSGMSMWFDPAREVPGLRSLPPDQRRTEPYYEGGALDGTSMEGGGVPPEGGDTKTSDRGDHRGLPF